MHYSLRTEAAYVYWMRLSALSGRATPSARDGRGGGAGLLVDARQRAARCGRASPLDALMATMRGRIGDVDFDAGVDLDADDDGGDGPLDRRGPDIQAREAFFPCYRATPSSTARATSAS
jgi:hypothetical protein